MAVFMVFSLGAGIVKPEVASAAPYDITEYPIPTSGYGAAVVATGSDGNIWFTEFANAYIGRMEPGNGTVTQYPIPTAGSQPIGITSGPDGALWFVGLNYGFVGRVDTGGTFTEYPIPSGNSGETIASDGTYLWFTQEDANTIGRIDTGGNVTEFPIPTANSGTSAIERGPDGNMWFTQRNANQVARIDSSGNITEYPLPTPNSEPFGIAEGPDGNVWFALAGPNSIGRIDVSTYAITEYPIPTGNSQPIGVVAGPDGYVWFTQSAGNKIARMDPNSGAVVEYPIATADASPWSITVGPDDNIWFSQFQGAGNNIGMLELPDFVTDAAITKTLLNQGEINVGDMVTYEVVVMNTGETALSGAFDFTDYFPSWLNYESANLPSGSCQAYQPGDSNLDPILQAYLPNHLEYGGIQCAGVGAPAEPGSSVSLQLNFLAVAEPGRDNYIAFGLQDVNEDDGGIEGLLVGGQPGDDLIDNWLASSPRHNNMAVAAYAFDGGNSGTGALADSGTPVIPALGVVVGMTAPALILTRRRLNYSGR